MRDERTVIPDERTVIPDKRTAIPDERTAIPDEKAAIPIEKAAGIITAAAADVAAITTGGIRKRPAMPDFIRHLGKATRLVSGLESGHVCAAATQALCRWLKQKSERETAAAIPVTDFFWK